MTSADEFLMAGGAASAKFPIIGTTVTGAIISPPEVRQQTDFDTGKPMFWEDGNPRMQLMVIVQTTERDPSIDDDNGQRAIYVKGQMKNAVRDAVKKAAADGLRVGGTLTVTYVADGQPNGRGKPPKQYTAAYVAPASTAASEFLNSGQDQQAPPAAPTVPAPVPAAPQAVPGVNAEAFAALQQLTPQQRTALGL